MRVPTKKLSKNINRIYKLLIRVKVLNRNHPFEYFLWRLEVCLKIKRSYILYILKSARNDSFPEKMFSGLVAAFTGHFVIMRPLSKGMQNKFGLVFQVRKQIDFI
jgi:hypothetical protein